MIRAQNIEDWRLKSLLSLKYWRWKVLSYLINREWKLLYPSFKITFENCWIIQLQLKVEKFWIFLKAMFESRWIFKNWGWKLLYLIFNCCTNTFLCAESGKETCLHNHTSAKRYASLCEGNKHFWREIVKNKTTQTQAEVVKNNQQTHKSTKAYASWKED